MVYTAVQQFQEMIIDLPTGDDFKFSGIDFLNIAWNIVIGVLEPLQEATESETEYYVWENGEIIDTYFLLTEELVKEYWKKAQRQISTALILIQQGTELLLKGHIATVDPYLLISSNLAIYSEVTDGCDIRFSDLKTIDARELIKVYNTVSDVPLPEDFQRRFEALRSKRNIVMHSVNLNSYIRLTDLLVQVLEVFYHLASPGSWLDTRKSFIENMPGSLLWEPEAIRQFDYIKDILATEVDLVFNFLQPSEVRKHFGFEKKQRRYVCPYCYGTSFRECYSRGGSDEHIPRLAQLSPNEPGSVSVYCLVCSETSLVFRDSLRWTPKVGQF